MSRAAFAIVGALLLAFWAGSAAAQERANLTVNFARGQKFALEIETAPEPTTRPTVPVPAFGVRFAFEVLEVYTDNGEPAALLQATCERVWLLDRGQTIYDSARPGSPAPEALKVYSALVGGSVQLRVNQRGIVSEVLGVEQLVQRAAQGLKNERQARDQLTLEMRPESLAGVFQQFFALVPASDTSVQTGKSWSLEHELPMGIPMLHTATFTAREVGSESVTVAVQARLEGDASAPVVPGPQRINAAVKGERTGTLRLDRATGLLIEGSLRQTLSGDVVINFGGQQVKQPVSTALRITLRGSPPATRPATRPATAPSPA